MALQLRYVFQSMLDTHATYYSFRWRKGFSYTLLIPSSIKNLLIDQCMQIGNFSASGICGRENREYLFR